MAQRKILKDVNPPAFEVMLGFEKYLTKSSINNIHAERVKIRIL